MSSAPHNPAKHVLLLGGTGFLGRETGLHLTQAGYKVRVAARDPSAVAGRLPFPCSLVAWDGQALDPSALAGCDAVVNLVGESIATEPWSPSRRDTLIASRVRSIAALRTAIDRAPTKPKVVIQASAIGIYGDRGDDELTEASRPGVGFLADVCRAWEDEVVADPGLGIRVVRLRIGVVLGVTGGALAEMLSVYAKGLGGTLGSGRQWMSWIHVDDLVRLCRHAIEDDGWVGVTNCVAPVPCRQVDFNATLAELGGYRAAKRVPATVLRAALRGQAALVLDSARVVPEVARKRGFAYAHPDVRAALTACLPGSSATNLRRFVARQWIAAPLSAVWDYFSRPRNLETLTPPWLDYSVVDPSKATIDGDSRIRCRLRLRGVLVNCESRVIDWQPLAGFTDEQVRGPFSIWRHQHRFVELAGGTLMIDEVSYRLPAAPLSEIIAGRWVERQLAAIFAYRSRAVAAIAKDLR